MYTPYCGIPSLYQPQQTPYGILLAGGSLSITVSGLPGEEREDLREKALCLFGQCWRLNLGPHTC